MSGFETKPEWKDIRRQLAELQSNKFGRKQIAKGVILIVCESKDGKQWNNQSLRFNKDIFPTIKETDKWYNENWVKKDLKAWDMIVGGIYTHKQIKSLGIIPVSYRDDDCACKVEEFTFDYMEFSEGADLAIIGDMEDGYKEIQVFECDKYTCNAIDEGGKQVMVLHGSAVTTAVSNKQRFPPEVLAQDGPSLKDKPLIVYHSKFPEAISHFDIIGMIVDAKFNEEEKRLEFWAKVFDEKAIEILEQRKSDGKPLVDHFSVGFYHSFKVDDDGIKVSTKVDFHHLGWLLESDAADKDSDTLEISHSDFPENIVSALDEKADMAYNTITMTTPDGRGNSIKFSDNTSGKKFYLVPYPQRPSNVWDYDFKQYWSTKGTDGKRSTIISKEEFQKILDKFPATEGDTVWLVYNKSSWDEGRWWLSNSILADSEPTDEELLKIFGEGEYRMFKVGRGILDDNLIDNAYDLPMGDRDFTITTVLGIKKIHTANMGAGSSAEIGVKPMDEKTAKEQAEELVAKKAELEKLEAEIVAKEEAIKEKTDALEAALKEKEEAEKDAKEKAELLQQVDEEKLAAKVEELIANGTFAAAKREEVLNLLKPLDEEARKNFLAVLETKDKDAPIGDEQGREGAPDDNPDDKVELISDEAAEKMSQELYKMPYAELVTGKKQEVIVDANS